jgi:DNA recombination protein RmuC
MDFLLGFTIGGLGLCLGWIIGSRGKQKEIDVLYKEHLKVAEEKSFLEAQLLQEKEKGILEWSCLSQKMLKENTKEFSEVSQEKIDTLLAPLKQKIDIFSASLQEIAKAGTAERLTLKHTIQRVAETNQALAQEAGHLARVLKGDVKRQGCWGELILQKVLETSGLRENQEYVLQGGSFSLQDGEGKRLMPDVIVNLPDSKKVVIDAKMSYRHYDDYIHAKEDMEKEHSLKKLVASMKEHIRSLSEKSYHSVLGTDTPSFVMLFVPIEAIFALVMEMEPTLFEDAWQRSIILVSPSNLLAILRTVESVWKIEQQNRNTQKIAEEGAALYDKFVDFLRDMEAVGKSLNSSLEHFDKAMQKLSLGRGNLVKKTEELRRLGLKTKKQIASQYLEEKIEEDVPV